MKIVKRKIVKYNVKYSEAQQNYASDVFYF